MVYPDRSLMEGEAPESTHDTVKAAPPGTTAPSAGEVNFTSANASGHEAKRERRALVKRMTKRVAENYLADGRIVY